MTSTPRASTRRFEQLAHTQRPSSPHTPRGAAEAELYCLTRHSLDMCLCSQTLNSNGFGGLGRKTKGVEDDQYNLDYESTGTPEYDYNSTIEFSFFINASSEDLEKFLMGRETETETKGEKETVGGGHEEKPTEPTIFDTDQASQSTPLCSLLTLVLMVHPLLRLL
uniref:Cocaine- and amphetamine-regulated transcript 4 n=1 Tax=Cyprinus carpio carpio TaxID=630221 RepID=A0A9J7ZV04_CYPCA